MTTVEQLMKDVQKITKGQVTLTLEGPEAGRDGQWICRAFEERIIISQRVVEQIKAMNPARLTASAYMDLLVDERERQVLYGTGRTAIRAVAALLDKIEPRS